MYHVYFLKSRVDDKFYIGSTNDVNRRLKEHNKGETPSTKNRAPFDLVYCESYTAKRDALEREKYIKQFKNAYTQLKKRIQSSIDNV